MAANLYAAAVNSTFVLVVRNVEDQKTITSELSPGQSSTPGSAATGGADAWAYLRGLSGFFGAASEGSKSINVVYADGGTAAQATNTLTFSTNPANNDTITLQGVTITLVTGTPSGSQVKIGSTLATTMQNICDFINKGGNNGGIAGVASAVITTAGSVITLYALCIGIVGNAITLAKSSTAISVGGATFSGGAATTQATPVSAGI